MALYDPSNFQRYDESPDALFYRSARLVTHIDEQAVSRVTSLYRRFLPPRGAILDLMSSWVSHLPPEVQYRRVVGLGMNEAELDSNPRLDEWLVQDLNLDPTLPFDDDEFDAAAICVSIQYLTRPTEVLRELGRVVLPGGPIVVTFSNRCFPTKAVALWQRLNDDGHTRLVQRYLRDSGAWDNIEHVSYSSRTGDPLFAVIGRSTGA